MLFVALLSFLSACGEPAPAEAASGLASTDLGAAVFAARCATCHGPEGRGDGPAAAGLVPPVPDLWGPRPAHLRGQPGGRRAIIEAGSPGTAMVGFAGLLSPEELEAVYTHVHAMRHGTGGAAPADCGQGAGGAACGEDCGDCAGMGPGMGPGMGAGMGPGGGGPR